MKIKPAPSPAFEEQMCCIGSHHWSVARLAQLSSELPVFKLPIAHMNLSDVIPSQTLRQFAGHIKSVVDADMTKPIILCEDGAIMDGRHRVMHAIVNGLDSVKAVRFDVDPEPCRIDDE